MLTVTLARVARTDRAGNPTGLVVTKALGCACTPLRKGASKRRKRGAPEYLAWLESTIPGLKKKLKTFLKEEAIAVFNDIQDDLQQLLQKGLVKVSVADIERILAALDMSRWTALIGVVEEDLVDAFKANAVAAFDTVRFTPDEEIVELVNTHAKTWAAERAAGLVGMRRNADGSLVPNPNAKWNITDSTRNELRALIEDAIDEGWSVDTLKDELLDAHAFSAARAETIARTELAFAHVEGNLDAWKESGVVTSKKSILGSEHDIDDVCNDNAEADAVPLDGLFPSGHSGPPYHPNCVCDVIPVVEET